MSSPTKKIISVNISTALLKKVKSTHEDVSRSRIIERALYSYLGIEYGSLE
jgi:metal-responsive CopG/Arc/MetJ family transcriptional regulator